MCVCVCLCVWQHLVYKGLVFYHKPSVAFDWNMFLYTESVRVYLIGFKLFLISSNNLTQAILN